ncbi:hypothetical protein K402DRAFT_326494 [Aulographum hederae CBS 113979]|uniref:Golgi apparatus membrane protein TVP38 n=1 Tax=Aulographum hederae CBS 113979 TaxID=1176131 RepID=A0A6G1H9H1_9PEZI|nr:hypothetical protein K402DRAFT_326494 [Aulographum hederae CBS 113979]
MPSPDLDPRALAFPTEDPPEIRRSISPVWTRRSDVYSQHSRADNPRSLQSRIWKKYGGYYKQAMKTYNKLSPVQKVVASLVGITSLVLTILFLVYNEAIFAWLAPGAKKWRNITGGWMILWALTFVVSFPPLIGYSSCVTIAGFVYGFPNGWFIVASATILGSTASFLACRTLLASFSQRLVANDSRFAALALTLKHDGIKILLAIRLCPLPYSLSNGALATFPTVSPLSFLIATTIASPKLLLHIFVGSKLGEIAEKGGQMDAKTKAISYASIAIGVLAGIITGYVIYWQTTARAKALEAEERAASADQAGAAGARREYSDDPESGLMGESIREDDDDISLRDADGAYADVFDGVDADLDADAQDFRDEIDIGNVDDDEEMESSGKKSGNEAER